MPSASAENEKSLAAFVEMNDEQKLAVVDKSRTMQTRVDMKCFVRKMWNRIESFSEKMYCIRR